MSLLPHDPRQTEDAVAWPAMESGDLFRLTGPVGREAANDRDDVIRAQILLNHAGSYDLDRLRGPTGWAGGELIRSLRDYQRRKGLTVDGLMLPDGETMAALHDDLFDRLGRYNAPTTAEVDEHHDRLARYRDDDDRKVQTRPAIVMPGESAPAYVQRVASDVGDASPPGFTPGAQVSQALPINPAMVSPGGAQVGHVSPEAEKAGKILGKKVEEAINLLTLPVQVYSHAINDGPVPKLPSSVVDPAIEAESKTPPLMPSAPEEPPPEGRKAEEREPALEELIPPDMKPWVEGLTPFDQQLARELMLIYNRRGGPDTIKGNAIIVKEMMDALKKYPALAEGFEHVGGSHSPNKKGEPGHIDGEYKEERHFKNAETEGSKGGSWADITLKAKPELAKELGILHWHFNSGRLQKDGRTPVSSERKQKVRLEANSKLSRVDILEKPTRSRIAGQELPYDWESYQARIKDVAEQLVEQIEATRMGGK